MSAAQQKTALRRRMKALAASLDPAYNAAASRRICRALTQQPAYQWAGTVFCFVGTAREIDTRPFLEQVLRDGKRLCVPLCTGKGVMEARQIDSLDVLRPGALDILEPPASSLRVAPEQIDFCVVPCLCATADGARLGYGGGYYDRFLPGLGARAQQVLVCRSRMLVPEMPQEGHDVCFSWVITEASD